MGEAAKGLSVFAPVTERGLTSTILMAGNGLTFREGLCNACDSPERDSLPSELPSEGPEVTLWPSSPPPVCATTPRWGCTQSDQFVARRLQENVRALGPAAQHDAQASLGGTQDCRELRRALQARLPVDLRTGGPGETCQRISVAAADCHAAQPRSSSDLLSRAEFAKRRREGVSEGTTSSFPRSPPLSSGPNGK